jgi:hypothetical protein
MTDEYDLPDDLADRIQTYADRHPDATAAAVLGAIDALDPSDLDAVRAVLEGDDEFNQQNGGDPGDLLVKTAEPVTEADENTHRVSSENVSAEKSRNTNTPDGEGAGADDATGDESDTVINESSDESKQSPEDADAGETPENPPLEGGFFSSTPWFDAEVSAPRSGIYPPALDDREKWMGAAGKDGKQAFAPWGDRDHPEAEPEKDARWKWGLEENHADGATVDEWEEKDPRIDGRAFVQLESDPFAFVDGDDVRDPDTGAVHPVFRALLEHLGATYADISTSGTGVHATYHAPNGLPRDLPEAKWQIDTEAWGANDDPPKIEIYANTHLSITHGDHIPGSPLEVREWDDTALRAVLEANGKLPEKTPSTVREDYDLNGYEPTATAADETADDIRDIFRALNQLDPKRVGDRTIVREWTRDQRSFLPVWGSSNDNGTANYIDDRIWHDTGHDGGYGGPVVMAAIDAGLINHTGATPADVRGRTFFEAVDHLRDLGFSVPRLESGHETDTDEGADEESAETGRELLALDVVVEPANALAAAAAVEPDDLDKELPELEREAVDDVAIAVALADGMIDAPEEFPDDGRYTEAYYRARDHYGAPLPKYLDNSTLEERTDLIFAALERVEPKHVLDGCRSDVTVEDPSGEAIAKLNPTWEDSESGERILAGYGRGFYCVEHDVSFSPIVLAALENDLVFTEAEYPRGEAFKQAYRILREEYGAPLPKWRATVLEHVAVLPPAARVLGESSADRSLDDARKQTEALLRDAVDVRDRAQLLTNLPGTGKTFGAALIAADTPILYLVQRNELKQQMEDYAAEIRDRDDLDGEPTVAHLPILAAEPFDDAAIGSGVEAVREHGFDLLADREALLERADLSPEDDEDDDADGDVNLDRPTCPVADGEHGEAWAFAVQVARRLKLAPAVIHQYDTALFGEELPCQHDGDCPYSLGWEAVRNPDDCPDILVGSPGHAHVDSATTYFDRAADGDRVERSRAVVVDEFLGESYLDTYGDRYLDHATWLAEALAGVETREDLAEAGLDADTWVNLWLDGDGEEYADAADAIDRLEDGRQLCEARRAAERLLEDGAVDTDATPSASLDGAAEALADLRDGSPTDGDLAAARDRLARVHGDVEAEADRAYATEGGDTAGRLYALAEALDDVVAPLSAALEATDTDDLPAAVEAAADALPVGGDLRALLDDAVDALRGEDAPEGLLDAAVSALRGGRDGCRDLAIYATDGYAHPDAWVLLAGAIARDTAVAETETFAFDGDEGGSFKHLKTNRATVVADKNHHGALVVDHPAFTDITGDKCPVVGLDATGRPKLWKIALGRDVERRDIHDSDAERRGFLRANGYAVVQTTNDPLPYHGDPEGKNFGEDLELVKTAAEEYTGTGPGAIDDKSPAVISTKKVVDHLEEDLDAHADAVVNYENMKGSDALGDHQVAAILGSCHFSDTEPEKWALLAGESAGRGDTRGDTLDYGSDVANAYLRNMREDHTMQAILRAGRNGDDTVIFAHTAALRDDLPTVDEGVVLSAHSKGTLAVAEAAKEYRTEPFTVRDLVDAIADDNRAVGRRQVQNIVADLRESGYLRVLEEGGHGVDAEYELEEEPGLADVELPEPPDCAADPTPAPDEETPISNTYSWNFVRSDADGGGDGVVPPTRPTIPAAATAAPLADGVEPPG